MGVLILVRHGQSQWNFENRFTGWVDVPLTAQGEKDAELSGAALKDFHFDVGYTSRLQRGRKTLDAILRVRGQADLPIIEDSALNERHYGDLQGLNKAEMVKKYGEEKVRLWRRSYSGRPPNGESIEDCVRRTLPFFQEYILKDVAAGKTVIVAAHGNSIRPIIMFLDGLTGEQAAVLEIPFCIPYIYRFEGEKMTGKEILEVPGMEVKSTANIK